MTLTVQLSTDMAGFVQAEVARGAVASETALVTQALELYRELKAKHDDLRSSVKRSIEQAERGEVEPLDTEATKAEARRRTAQQV
jgi:Arc/MetJ-type ribon-helix-helix transcriptional regulator